METPNNFFNQNARVGKTRNYSQFHLEKTKYLDVQSKVDSQENKDFKIG